MSYRHTTILASIQGLSPRLRLWLRCLGVSEVLLALCLWALGSLALDWTFELPWLARLLLLGGLGVAVVLLARASIRRTRRQFEIAELAAVVETSSPELDGHLLNVLELPSEIRRLGEDGGKRLERQLLEKALDESCTRSTEASLAGSFNLAPVFRRGALAVASLLCVFYLATQAPTTFGVWLQRNVLLSSDLWPRQTHFTLDRAEAEWHQARKDPLEISGWVTGAIPRQVVLRLSGEDSHRDALIVPGAPGNVPTTAPSADRVDTLGSVERGHGKAAGSSTRSRRSWSRSNFISVGATTRAVA